MRMRPRLAVLLTLVVLGTTVPSAAAAPVVTAVPGTTALNAVACPSAGACVAAGLGAFPSSPSYDGVTVTVGDHASLPQPVPGVMTPSGTLLPVVDTLTGISCPTACLAVGPEFGFLQGGAVPVVGGHPGSVIALPSLEMANGVSCTSLDSCLAVGGETSGAPPLLALVPISHGVPGAEFGPPFVLGDLNGVSCRAGVCWAVGDTFDLSTGSTSATLVRVAGATAGAPQTATASRLSGISCPVADTCLAVGTAATGVVVSIAGGAVGTAVPVPGTSSLSAVSCKSVGVCLAVGQATAAGRPPEGVAVPVLGGVPQAPVPVAGVKALLGVACRAGACVAVGDTGETASRIGVVVTSLP